MNNRTSVKKITVAGVFLIIGMLLEIVYWIIYLPSFTFLTIHEAISLGIYTLFSSNIYFSSNLLPNLLILLYVFCFYKCNSGNILFSVSFLISTLLSIENVRTVVLTFHGNPFNIIFMLIIMPIIIMILSIMGTIGAFTGFKSFFNKKVVYLWSTFTILHIILNKVLLGMPVSSLSLYTIHYASILFFHIGIVILVKNGSFKKVTLKRKNIPEAVDLEKLKEQFEAGVITEEDYNEKRNNILKSL